MAVLVLKACDINSLIRGGAASCLRVEHNNFRAVCVYPILIGSLEEVLPSLHCGDPPTGTCSELPPQMLSRSSANPPLLLDALCASSSSDATRALARLEQLAVPGAGGVITHSYEPCYAELPVFPSQIESKHKLERWLDRSRRQSFWAATLQEQLLKSCPLFSSPARAVCEKPQSGCSCCRCCGFASNSKTSPSGGI